MKGEIMQANQDLSNGHIQSMLRRWFVETEGTVKVRKLNSCMKENKNEKKDFRFSLLTSLSRIINKTQNQASVKPRV